MVGLAHEHDLLLLVGDQHQHLGCKITAGERVLTIEGQWGEFGKEGVEQDKGNLLLVQGICERLGDIQFARHKDDTIRVCFHHLLASVLKRLGIKSFVIGYDHVDMKVTPHVTGFHRPFLDLFPIGFLLMPRDDQVEGIRPVIGQGAGIHVRTVMDFLENLFYFFSC